MNINLEIDSLILYGFNPAARARIAAVAQRELARLLAERGLPSSLAQLGAIARLNGGQFQVVPNARAETIGAQIARQLYANLSPGKENW